MIRISVTWKLLLIYAIVWFLIILMASCGTRKVNETTNKYTNSSYQKNESSGSNALNSNTSINSSIVQNNDKTDESQSKKVIELFNENGSLKSRITELLNVKSVDKSTTITNTVTKYTIRTITKWEELAITKNLITTVYKTRTVDKDGTLVGNLGGKGVVVGLGIFAITLIVGAVFLYFYLKNKKKEFVDIVTG